MRFGLAAVAAAAACGAVGAFVVPANNNIISTRIASSVAGPFVAAPRSSSTMTSSTTSTSTSLFASDPQQSIDFAIAEAGSNGVTLFGKSACPFCFKAKKALLAEGIHPIVVNLDEVEGGPAIQKLLEELTGKGTVPNVWVDGKFVGGSEEVLAGLEAGDDVFKDVERGEPETLEEVKKVPIVQADDAIKVGDTVPSAKVWTAFGDPDFVVDPAEYFKGKSLLVVGLPGAFTPTWSSQQVPSYLEYSDKLKEAGIDGVIIYCVNDPAVMMAWAKDQGVEGWELTDDSGYVSFLSDTTGDWTRAMGMEMTHPGPLSVGVIGRCKRFAFHAVDGVVKAINISEYEGDPAGDDYPEMSLPAAMLEAIKAE